MRGLLSAVIAIGLSVATPGLTLDGGQRQRITTQKAEPDRTELGRIGAMLQRQEYAEAGVAMDALVRARAFKDYPAELQRAVHVVRVSIELELGRLPEALTAAKAATAIEGAGVPEWSVRLEVATAVEDWADMGQSLVALSGFGLEAIENLDENFIVRHVAHSVPKSGGGAELQARVIDALFQTGWDPESSRLWQIRALQLAEQGDRARIAAYLRRIDQSSSRLAVSVDRRLDDYRTVVPEAFDVDAALATELETARLAASAEPGTLEDGYLYAYALMTLGRFEEGLVAVNAAIAKAEAQAAKPGAPAISSDDLIWALDTRSRILVFMGRHEEAVADLRRASRRPEGGTMNVSHAINLGALYNRIDRPADALEAVIDIVDGTASPFGMVQAALVRACAYAALGRQADLKATEAWIMAHAADDPDAVVQVAACTDNQSAAANDLIARLDDPVRRADALLAVQDYLPSPAPTAHDARVILFAQALRNRADVRAAIDRAGYVRSWPTIGPQF